MLEEKSGEASSSRAAVDPPLIIHPDAGAPDKPSATVADMPSVLDLPEPATVPLPETTPMKEEPIAVKR